MEDNMTKGQATAPSVQSPDFVKVNNKDGILLNTNNDALAKYKKAKARFAKINKIDELSDRMDNIESMLAKILEKL